MSSGSGGIRHQTYSGLFLQAEFAIRRIPSCLTGRICRWFVFLPHDVS